MFRIHTCGHVIAADAPDNEKFSICPACKAERQKLLEKLGVEPEKPRRVQTTPTHFTCSICKTTYDTSPKAGECCSLEKLKRREGVEVMRGKLIGGPGGLVRRKQNW